MKDYKKILEGVVDIINATEKSDIGFVNICTYIGENCPELKESEDEKIRKAIHIYLDWLDGKKDIAPRGEYSIKDMIDWLIKQKPVDKVEPIANDLMTEFQKQVSYLIASVLNREYDYTQGYVEWVAQSLLGYAKNEQKPEWSEEDEKMVNGIITILKPLHETECNYNKYKNSLISWLKSLKNRVQPKQEWSEEDETGWTNTMIMIKECASNHYTKDSIKLVVDWLKSLKDRIQPQPKQEWSEEDEEKLNSICNIVADKRNLQKQGYRSYYNGLINWLKSLRPQSHWKPTEYDLRYLQAVVNDASNAASAACNIALRELLEQLKQL